MYVYMCVYMYVYVYVCVCACMYICIGCLSDMLTPSSCFLFF